MSVLRTAVAGASRSAVVIRPTAVRHFASSSVTLAADQHDAKDPQLGDYPEVPMVSLQRRKYSPNWWDPQEKRNYGETLHEQDDILSVWAPDVHAMPASSALRQLLVAAGAFGAAFALIYAAKPDRPALPRTYPRDGLAAEIGGPKVAARKEGSFAAGDDEEDQEDDE